MVRSILGPFADQKSVDALNAKLGTDQSLFAQYWDWISGVFTGDMAIRWPSANRWRT